MFCLMGKVVIIDIVKSEKNATDLLTKGLSKSTALDASRHGVKPIDEIIDNRNSTFLIGQLFQLVRFNVV